LNPTILNKPEKALNQQKRKDEHSLDNVKSAFICFK
jgi:hypothetical protein